MKKIEVQKGNKHPSDKMRRFTNAHVQNLIYKKDFEHFGENEHLIKTDMEIAKQIGYNETNSHRLKNHPYFKLNTEGLEEQIEQKITPERMIEDFADRRHGLADINFRTAEKASMVLERLLDKALSGEISEAKLLGNNPASTIEKLGNVISKSGRGAQMMDNKPTEVTGVQVTISKDEGQLYNAFEAQNEQKSQFKREAKQEIIEERNAKARDANIIEKAE